jgi:hypothetical protein
MNETDVREIIVRPLLDRLGYKHGTVANIRTEVPLRYDRAFLGRKNPKKDPPLVGRADYICDATSYGRWAVEVKAPNHALTQDDVEQAHTYCAHPEICASYFILTNGREFRLYSTGKLDEALLSWLYEETSNYMMTIFNVIGYEAIRKKHEITRPDLSKPLGAGLQSRHKIIGGEVVYGEHRSDHPLLQVDALKGMVGAVTGIGVERTSDGRLHATVTVLSPYQQFHELNRLAGVENFEFFCSDEYISNDVERPTIFQNVVEGRLEPGESARFLPGMPEIILPFGFKFTVVSEATGYVDSATFKGVVAFDYYYEFIRGSPSGNPNLDHMVSNMPRNANLVGEGRFNILLSSAS